METRGIGSLDVSAIGLGTNNFGFRMDEDEVPAVVDAALEAGITFFDTADAYGRSERRLAKALGARREHVVVATKFGSPSGPIAPAAPIRSRPRRWPRSTRSSAGPDVSGRGSDRVEVWSTSIAAMSDPMLGGATQ